MIYMDQSASYDDVFHYVVQNVSLMMKIRLISSYDR